MNWLDKAIEVAEKGAQAVLITVASVEGSSPREAGAKMLVLADDSIGTIGGGALELDAIKTAREMLVQQQTILKDYPLGPSLEQCCGGFVRLMFENIAKNDLAWLKAWQQAEQQNTTRLFKTSIGVAADKFITDDNNYSPNTTVLIEDGDNIELHEWVTDNRQALWIFGGGHVAKALINTLAPLNFAITIVDQRAEFIDQLSQKGVSAIHNDVPFREVENIPPSAMVLIMTHSHAQDFDICYRALNRGDLGFVGLIGSATKKARFIKRLRDKGLGEQSIQSMICPIGLGETRDKRPEAIAISVAAQLIEEAQRQIHSASQPASVSNLK